MTRIKLTNIIDKRNAERGLIRADQVRSLELEVLVDTGATTLVIPAEVAEALGLTELNRRRARLADGSLVEVPTVTDLLIEVLGREMSCDALVSPRGALALLGQIPLEALDLIVDPKSRELRVNPASPDTPLLDMLGVPEVLGPASAAPPL